MRTSDWPTYVALLFSGVSLGISLWTMWVNGRRLKELKLREVQTSILELAYAAIEHTYVGRGEHPTEADIERRSEDAEFLADRLPYEDVRRAVRGLVAACKDASRPGTRDVARFEERNDIREAVRAALKVAQLAIGERMDALGSARALSSERERARQSD